jgi:hypothetical protein
MRRTAGGRLAEAEDLNALLHMKIIGSAVALNVSIIAPLLVPPLCVHALLEAIPDSPIQLVDIHRVDAPPEWIPLRLSSAHIRTRGRT